MFKELAICTTVSAIVGAALASHFGFGWVQHLNTYEISRAKVINSACTATEHCDANSIINLLSNQAQAAPLPIKKN